MPNMIISDQICLVAKDNIFPSASCWNLFTWDPEKY